MAIEKQSNEGKWAIDLAHKLGKDFEKRAEKYDQDGTFVKENYADLKKHGFFTLTISKELGGEGLPHSQMCDILRVIGQYSGSTGLAMSMHHHLLAATIWKYKKGKGGEKMLKKVVDQQLILISTGARDWLDSNGNMEKTEGGFLLTAKKYFASQSAVGDMLVTSAPYKDPKEGWQVLHFPVPIKSEGVIIMNDWYVMGMRGTGSHTIKLEKVFIPESAIALRRPRDHELNPAWNIALTVAMPLIMSPYVGIAEKSSSNCC